MVVFDQLVSLGFYETNIAGILDTVNLSTIVWVPDGAPNVLVPQEPNDILSTQLNCVDDHIRAILAPAFKSVVTGKIELWDGTEPTSCEWHNDLVEGWNLFALIYFNDMDPENGGSVSFKTPADDVYTVYPKYGTCVFVNMEPWYFHKVEPLCNPQPRVVLNICYRVEF